MGCSPSNITSCIQTKYKFGHVLGKGTYALVRVCVKRDADFAKECGKNESSKVQDSDTVRAVKILQCRNERSRAEARNEGALWKRVSGHRHVVDLLETFADNCFAYFVMERCDYSLQDMSNMKNPLSEAYLLVTFLEMLQALQHCHSLKVVHRDVKPSNFLVSFDGEVKLCDFGLAELEREDGIVGDAGTAPFMSPEMVHGQPYNHKTDIWSLGATAYVLLYGHYPYKSHCGDHRDGKASPSERDLMHRAIATDSPQPTYVEENGLHKPSLEARKFVQALLQRDPFSRPSSNECFCTSAMRNAYKISKCVDSKKQRDIGLRGLPTPWTPSADKNNGALNTLSANQNDGAQDIADTPFEVTDVVEVIDQFRLRRSKKVTEMIHVIDVIQRWEDPPELKVNLAELKVNLAEAHSKDHIMCKLSIESASTAYVSEGSLSSGGQVSIDSATQLFQARVESEREPPGPGIVCL